jgi:condensin complex subunit 1
MRSTRSVQGPSSRLRKSLCSRDFNAFVQNTTLRAVATLSFSKFLCISSNFCDANHHLLFRILETSKDANIRSNIAIALGDVAVSFSTIIDENSDELYRGLSDTDLVVKKNTLMVLTHLILNGMIKVKGQLGEMAKCLEDDEPRIADLAKLFFTDLSTKDNAIYNNLPDGACAHSLRPCFTYTPTHAHTVISHLSVGDHAMDEEGFQRTMRYIFTFIEKVRASPHTSPFTHPPKHPSRKSKQKASSRSYASVSG